MASEVGASSPERLPVLVVGAGISGVACARALTDAGVPVRLLDRGRRVGGRMAVRTLELPAGRHAVDVGAAYFTAHDPGFRAVVQSWQQRSLAQPWTDTFHLADTGGLAGTTTGPVRWAAAAGLRSLVEDLARGLAVDVGRDVQEIRQDGDGRPTVDGDPAAAVVLAMPDPQAGDVLTPSLRAGKDLAARHDWTPTICVWAAWSTRWWPDLDGVFVHDDPVLSWVADDGRRRGDDAPVLVAHTPAVFAAGHLHDPAAVVEPVLAELGLVLGRSGRSLTVPSPEVVGAYRWRLSAPRRPRGRPFHLGQDGIGLCGDAWGERPRIEQAWLSGHGLGVELASRLRG